MRTRALASLLSLAIAGASLHPAVFGGIAHAQMDADTKEAKTLFEDGVKLYKEAKYEEARVKFKAAYGLKKRPSIIINLARSELQTKRPLDAAAHFKETLALPDLKPEDRDDARAGLADARKQLGSIVVDAPAGSTVQVDGANAPLPDDNTIDVVAGMHTVSIKNGGKETNEKVSLDAGKSQTVHFKTDTGAVPVVVPPPDTTATPTPPPPDTTATTPPPTTETTTTSTTSAASPTPKDEGIPSNGPGFFQSIHPVTYIAAGVTVVAVVVAIPYALAAKTHSDNANALAGAIVSHTNTAGVCTSTRCSTWKSQGRDETDQFNSDKTLATVFGVVAGVAAVATVVTFFTMRKKAPSETAEAAPTWMFGATPLPGGGGAFALSGAF
ncbi:MAG: hypothetical protein NVS3B10_25150 [Polyangiales bacterium]